jgi:hypothetical protein
MTSPFSLPISRLVFLEHAGLTSLFHPFFFRPNTHLHGNPLAQSDSPLASVDPRFYLSFLYHFLISYLMVLFLSNPY